MTDYKSVTDSGEIRLDGSVTCLVGKNESGKTAILEPLYRLKPIATGHPGKFTPLHDYPRARYTRERADIDKKKPVEVKFDLTADDVAALEKELATGAVKPQEVTLWRRYDNGYSVSITVDEGPVVQKVIADANLDPALAEGLKTVADLRTKLQGDEQTAAIAALLTTITDLDPGQKARNWVVSHAPRLLYFNEYSVLPGRVSVPLLQNKKEEDLEAGERTALSLLRLAAVDTKDFAEDDYEARKAALEAASAAITDEVFEYWSQNKELRVELDLDFKAPPGPHGELPPFLDIRIRNERHHVTLNFSERSRGFVWFFSFLVAFSEYRDKDEKLVLLLDEPGLGLHGAAQSDLLRFIEEKLAPKHHVVYSTHSPFMVDAAKLDRVRMVEDIDGKGTTVSEDVMSTNRDTVFPLQAALGYELAQSLFVGPNNIVVEGPADYLYLTIISALLTEKGRTALDPKWVIVPVGGLDKIPTFVALLGAKLNVAVVMDTSAGGSQKINELIKRGIIEQKNVVTLNTITGTKEADIEDLFDIDFYLDLLKDSGTATVEKAKLPPGPRIVKRVEEFLGIPYDHYSPARYFLENQVKLLPRVDDATQERFEKLFTELNKLLR